MNSEQEIDSGEILRNLAITIIEQCANAALEQRGRGALWDLACTTIAAKISELAEPHKRSPQEITDE